MLATRITNAEEDEVLEEYERLEREALGLPDVPIHTLPQKEPTEEDRVQQLLERQEQEQREAIPA